LQAEMLATNVKLQRLEKESKNCNLVLYNFDPRNRGSLLLEDVMKALNLHVANLGVKMTDIKDFFYV
jgi:DNA polymerase III psi subunit